MATILPTECMEYTLSKVLGIMCMTANPTKDRTTILAYPMVQHCLAREGLHVNVALNCQSQGQPVGGGLEDLRSGFQGKLKQEAR